MTITSSSIIKKLLILFLVFAGLYYAKDFLMPLAIAAVVATLFLPLCKWLEAKKLHRGIAVLFCFLVLLSTITLFGTLIGWQVSELTNDLSLIKQKAIEVIGQIQEYIFHHLGVSIEDQSQMIKGQQSGISEVIPMLAGSTASLLTDFILILAYIFFMLYYRVHISRFFLKLSPPEQQSEMEQLVNSAARVSQQYLTGLTKMIVCLWIMYGIGFSALGVHNALFFAFLCGLLEIVPFIGNITGTTITVLVAMVHGASIPVLGGIVITYATVQFIQGWILEPLIVGHHVKINPLFTIIALVLGELVWGISGIFLAIPLTAMLKIVFDHIEPLKPYGFLIGETETKQKESGIIKKLRDLFRKN